MSVESIRSRTPLRKYVYPLKRENLPYTEEMKNEQFGNLSTANDGSNTKNYDIDEDFKFKRHKNKNLNGIPSLGERLDNFQDVKKAKWMSNFSSSVGNLQDQLKSQESVETESSNNGSSQAQTEVPTQQQMVQWVYCYNVPTPGTQPFVNSPMMIQQPDPTQLINSSISMVPNTSMQPFFPPHLQPSQTNKLLPAPSLFPMNFQQQVPLQSKPTTKDRRKLFVEKRGKRLSIVSSENGQFDVISPHKDVPEKEFYKHIGNTSFGRNLQIRQLFHWCSTRAFDKLQKNVSFNTDSIENDDFYLNPKKIAFSAITDFLHDLKKDELDVDWEADEDDYEDDDDTQLNKLFNDNDTINEIQPENLESNSKKTKLPNVRNIENEKNLKTLDNNIQSLKDEIIQWNRILEIKSTSEEWKDLGELIELEGKTTSETKIDETIINTVEQELTDRLNRLQFHSHLINSFTTAMSDLTQIKIAKITDAMKYQPYSNSNKNRPTGNLRQPNSKALLQALSESLASN